jgi:phosphatidyl-myo-inositol alpha-mannosyltransferase
MSREVVADRRAVVFVSLARGLGGSTRSLATVLEPLGTDVYRVLAAPSDGKYIDYVSKRGLIDFHLKLWDSSGARNWRIKRLAAAVRLVRWARRNRHRIAAIHANGPEEVNLAAPAAWAAKVPLVVWIHAFEVSPWQRRLGPVWRRLLARRQVWWAAVSGLARRVLVETGMAAADDIVIVPNPIDPADVRAVDRKPAERVTIGFIGTAEERKGFPMLPGLVEELSDLPVHWVFYSNEFSRDAAQHVQSWQRLKAQPSEIVSFPGKVEDIRQAYAQCDIVFCPSSKESFCRVAAEAMINGVPVVASDLEPLKDLLGDDEAGLLFNTGDSAGAAEAIRRLVGDAELRVRLGQNGMERARAFEPDRVVKQLRALYGLNGATGRTLEVAAARHRSS